MKLNLKTTSLAIFSSIILGSSIATATETLSSGWTNTAPINAETLQHGDKKQYDGLNQSCPPDC
jgi:hypothetical protein